jgi:hypothetical protein
MSKRPFSDLRSLAGSIELNRHIVERLRLLRSTKSLAQLASFSTGMIVEFDADDGRPLAAPWRVRISGPHRR